MAARIDPHSPTWRAVRAHVEAEIARQSRRLEVPTMDATQTALLRGNLQALRELLQLADAATDGEAP